MDMLMLGETIVAPSAGQNHYGFWMPSRGSKGVGGCEVFFTSNLPFNIFMETKSSDQADSSATVVSVGTTALNAVGAFKFDVTNALDLVRYRVTSTGAGGLHVQFAQPLWQPN
jgi:hypothetical protein